MLRTVGGVLVCGLLAAPPAAAAEWSIASPDGRVRATVVAREGRVALHVRRGGARVLAADLGPVPAGRPAVGHRRRRERFVTPSGKRRRHELDARVLRLAYARGRAIEVLAAADGVGIRQTGAGPDRTAWKLRGGARAWIAPLTFNYEARYRSTALRRLRRDAYAFPALVRTGRGAYVLLTEAGLDRGNPAAHLFADRPGTLRLAFPPSRRATRRSGWRVAVLGGLDTVVGSDLVLALGRPSRLRDTAWIRPGRVAWSWWVDPDSPGDLARQRDYVDFAAAQGWEYVLVDEGWSAAEIPPLVAYARARGVRVLLWTDWRALAGGHRRGAVLERWARWGVAGVKADFLHSDAGPRLAAMEAIAAAAARRRMVVNFHGATVPRGLQRTYPNVLTVEGVLGAEHARAGDGPRPQDDVTLTFTRNAVGSMDYTPVAFSARGRVSSDAHTLAQAIVFESGLQHYADAPESYRRRPAALALLRAVPAAWDDTRLLGGRPGRSVVLARRVGAEWFVGALAAGAPRTVRVPLNFLPTGRTYAATITTDGPGGLVTAGRAAARGDVLRVPLARDGGFAVRLAPQDGENPDRPAAAARRPRR